MTLTPASIAPITIAPMAAPPSAAPTRPIAPNNAVTPGTNTRQSAPPLTPALEACPVTFEFDQTENPFRDAVVDAGFRLNARGMIDIPQKPGLGIRVIPEAVAEYRRRERRFGGLIAQTGS